MELPLAELAFDVQIDVVSSKEVETRLRGTVHSQTDPCLQ